MRINSKKFLSTYAAAVATAKYVPQGHNGSNLVVVEYVTTSALASGETLTLTLPSGLEIVPPAAATDTPCLLPVLVSAWTNANPRLKELAASLLITSFDADTNVVVLTAAGAGIGDKCTVSLLCVLTTLRTA